MAPAVTSATTLIDPASLERAEVCHEPFPFLIANDMLPDVARAALQADFPDYRQAGFFPHVQGECGPSINRLIDEITGPVFAGAIGARLDVPDLARFPTLVTICRLLNARHGTIHTDSHSKVVTVLLYFSDRWPDTGAGCLRFLRRIDDIDNVIAEVKPLFGRLVAFRRADNSFHGHLPFEGERPVIQVAWLTSADEKLRKARRGRASRLVKKMLGALDRRFGAGRDRNAAHED
jgi:hypothetical protein